LKPRPAGAATSSKLSQSQNWTPIDSLKRGEQLAGALDVAGSNRAGEEAVVADAMEAAGQHVQEKAADELGRVERIGLRRSRPLIR